jgi:hypothetical protein
VRDCLLIERKAEVVGVASQSHWEIPKASEECWCTPNVCLACWTVRITAKLAEKLEAVVDDHFTALRAVGFDDGQIIEIVLQVSLNTG